MTYEQAKAQCHVRSAIYRLANPEIKYYKNHTLSLDARVVNSDKYANDWEEYDPRDNDNTSLFMFND